MTPFAALIACAVAVADWGPVRVDADGVPLPPGVLARVGSTRFRHEGTCHRVHFPPDGRRVLGVTSRGLYTWDARTGLTMSVADLGGIVTDSAVRADGVLVYVTRSGRGSEAFLRTRPRDGRPSKTVLTFDDDGSHALSPDGTHLAVRTAGLVRLFTTTDAKLVGDTRLSISDYDPHTLAVSPDNRNVLAAYRSWTEVREVATGNVVYAEAVGANDEIREAVFTPDGREVVRAVDGEKKNCLDVIDLTAGRVKLLHESTDRVGKLVVPPDGRTVYAVKDADLVRIERATGSVASFGFASARGGRAFVSPDGRQVATAGDGQRVTFWNPQTGQRSTPAVDLDATGHAIEFSTGGRQILLNDRDLTGVVHLIDVAERRIARTIRFGASEDVCFLPNGTEYAVATAKLLQIKVVAADAVTFAAKLNHPEAPALYTAGGGRLLFAWGDERVDAWDRVANEQLEPFTVDRQKKFLPLPDGRSAMSWVQRSTDGESRCDFRRIDLRDRRPRPEEAGFQASWPRLTFDPTSRFALFHRPRNGLSLFDIPADRVRPPSLPFRGCDPTCCSFTPDGRTLVGQHGNADARTDILVVETSTGKLRGTLPLHGELLASAFSPDGRTLAVLSPTAPLYLYDFRGTLLNLPQSLDPPALAALWNDLLGDDAEVSFRALQRLAAAPDSTIPFVRGKVPPAKGPTKPEFDALVAALEAPAFRDREAAMKELTRLAGVVETELRAAEKATDSPEVRQRLEKVLRATLPEAPEAVRRSRIVEVVEWCGTGPAKRLLKEWAGGATGAALTQEARLALTRLGG